MRRAWLALALVVAAAATTGPRAASACGGFFCQTAPVDQSGEKILFAVDQNGIEVHVQIRYQGDDADFAWVVPTRQVPTLAVGIDSVFTALEQRTAPSFSVDFHVEGTCSSNGNGTGGTGGGSGGAGGTGGTGGSGVGVIAQEVVGPYDSAILQASDGTALHDWLTSNGYLLTPAGVALLDPYVADNDYFVALKLHSGRTTQDLAPIVLRFAGGEPCVPLRLTAVAALNDMEVTAFFLGQHRAVPTNYYELTPDLARLDWINGGYNYTAVVSAAADEASGNAFVTEYAGPSSIMAGALSVPAPAALDALRAETDPIAYVGQLVGLLPPSGQLLGLLRRWIPMPPALVAQGLPDTVFYNCLSCYAQYLVGFAFDPAGMTDDLDRTLVQPLAEASSLFETFPVLTRLYTRISPPEMTSDPLFAENPDLPAVSNVHTADAYIECGDGGSYYGSPIRLVLPDGRVIWLPPLDQGSGSGDLARLPAAESWRQMSTSGPGIEVGNNASRIDQGLAAHNDAILRQYGSMGPSGGPSIPPRYVPSGTGGCAVTAGAPSGRLGGPAGLALLLGLAAAAARRRPRLRG